MTLELPDIYLCSSLGYDKIRPALRSGVLVRVRRGAYTYAPVQDDTAHDRTELLARCAAVAAQLKLDFAFSHDTAAFLHGLPVAADDVVHIVQTTHRNTRGAPDIRRHVTTDLDDVVELGGLPVTSLARTTVDATLRSQPASALAMADAGIRKLAGVSRFTREESMARQSAVRAELIALLHSRGPVRYARIARAALSHADGLAESSTESWLRWLAISRGLPSPTVQFEVHTSTGWYFADLGWAVEHGDQKWRVLAEYDGRVKYQGSDGAAALRKELLRESRLTGSRSRIIRFDADDLRNPDAAFARLCAAFPTPPQLHPIPDLMPVPRRNRRRER